MSGNVGNNCLVSKSLSYFNKINSQKNNSDANPPRAEEQSTTIFFRCSSGKTNYTTTNDNLETSLQNVNSNIATIAIEKELSAWEHTPPIPPAVHTPKNELLGELKDFYKVLFDLRKELYSLKRKLKKMLKESLFFNLWPNYIKTEVTPDLNIRPFNTYGTYRKFSEKHKNCTEITLLNEIILKHNIHIVNNQAVVLRLNNLSVFYNNRRHALSSDEMKTYQDFNEFKYSLE